MRVLHRWPGLIAAVLLIVLSLSGVALSVLPALEVVNTPAQVETNLGVAELAARIIAAYPGVEQIQRAPSGRITADYVAGDTSGTTVIDPGTGRGVGSAEPSAAVRWLTNLHRSLFLGDTGRIVTAIGAGAMLVLAFSGIGLVTRRVGGLRRFFAPLKGPLPGRLHVEIARFAVAGLILSSATALWMTASTFGFLPDTAGSPPFPAGVSGQAGLSVADIPFLQDTPISVLRDLSFPRAGDATDAFTIRTNAGQGYLDQGTGAVLAWKDSGVWDRVTETIYMLHTGQGAAVIGLALGLMALGVPVMAGTGVLLWVMARRGRARLRGNAAPGQADTILLVGSEGGATWGFAATLRDALVAAGERVHTAPMSTFAPARYSRAKRIIVLAATYGDGAAPASAKGFLNRLTALTVAPGAPLVVLGFGDRSFPHFCGFAADVVRAAEARGWAQLLPMESVDRQSPQDFARWGRALGAALGLPFELNHHPIAPRTAELPLISRRDYGGEVQAPTAILRFSLPRASIWRRLTGRGRFAPGDLLGILPEGATVPRFYSLASARGDGFVEICVRKHPGGLCSGQLLDLRPGQTIRAFIRRNPGFHPVRGRKPVILIGAGTGIGPLAGFARSNGRRRPMHLWFGARRADSDFLYGEELAVWRAEGRLTSVTTTFSRSAANAYVQDALHRDAARIASLIAGGARVMVCGRRDMAAGVAAALTDILAPLGLTPAALKAEGRYAEDIY